MQHILGIPRAGFHQFAALWAGIETLFVFLFLNPRHRMIVAAVKKHGGFDRRFYQAQLPRAQRLYRLFALRHYAVFGEKSGLSPSGQFNPATYLRLNPDVNDAGVPPLWHWLTKGQHECRRLEDPANTPRLPDHIPKLPTIRVRDIKARNAVHIHVHYPEVLNEILAYLGGTSLEFDLFVTISYRGPETLQLTEDLQVELPNAEVNIVENRGRDILPFITLLNQGAFEGYEAVCKLHTKRSTHRVDGDRWRKRLLSGILSRNSQKLLQKFLNDPDSAVWVADGQLLQSGKWWGENKENVDKLLGRIELKRHSENPYFPSGSMYWIKPFTLGMLASLQLQSEDFEEEAGLLDGTLAHAVERAVGELALASGQKVVETSKLKSLPTRADRKKPSFISALYLPQFHRTEENDTWWGEGYTEWTGVNSAQCQFDNQILLRPASELGEYDLTDTSVMKNQANLAQDAGIDAFCVYHYWFGEKCMLERPIDGLLSSRSTEFPFYLCWANESWRRNWDGLSGEILIDQTYPSGFELELAKHTARYMRDPRYQKPDGLRPRFVIYRPLSLPDPNKNIARLRDAWRDIGVGEVELGGVLFHNESGADPDLVDFWIEMPPHGLFDPRDLLTRDAAPKGLRKNFEGIVYDYAKLASRSNDPNYVQSLPHNCIRGAMPSWDNTARRGRLAHIAHGATPAGFRKWLQDLSEHAIEDSYRSELMINAWNEWGEKAVLEPSDRFGTLNLAAVREIARKK